MPNVSPDISYNFLRVGVLIQARLASTRLPQKVLLPLAGIPSLAHVLKTFQNPASSFSPSLSAKAIIAPYEDEKILRPLAEKYGFQFFGGNAENLVHRYYKACEFFNLDHYIRVTGDNPLTNANLASQLLQEHLKHNNDFSAFQNLPLGTGVEIVKTTALGKAYKEASDPYDLEHASPYLYKNPHLFKIARLLPESCYQRPDIRLTLDTVEDYENLKMLFASFSSTGEIQVLEKIIHIYDQLQKK